VWPRGAGRARAHLVQGVGQPRHELGLHKLRLAALELAVLLHGEGGGLQAELVDVVVARLQVPQVGRAAVHHRAGVGDAAALHLQVGEALQLVVRQGARWCLRAAHSASAGCSALQQAREEPVFQAAGVRSRPRKQTAQCIHSGGRLGSRTLATSADAPSTAANLLASCTFLATVCKRSAAALQDTTGRANLPSAENNPSSRA